MSAVFPPGFTPPPRRDRASIDAPRRGAQPQSRGHWTACATCLLILTAFAAWRLGERVFSRSSRHGFSHYGGVKKEPEARSQESVEKPAQDSQQEIIWVICVHPWPKALTTEENRRTLRATGCEDGQADSPPDLGGAGAASDGGRDRPLAPSPQPRVPCGRWRKP